MIRFLAVIFIITSLFSCQNESVKVEKNMHAEFIKKIVLIERKANLKIGPIQTSEQVLEITLNYRDSLLEEIILDKYADKTTTQVVSISHNSGRIIGLHTSGNLFSEEFNWSFQYDGGKISQIDEVKIQNNIETHRTFKNQYKNDKIDQVLMIDPETNKKLYSRNFLYVENSINVLIDSIFTQKGEFSKVIQYTYGNQTNFINPFHSINASTGFSLFNSVQHLPNQNIGLLTESSNEIETNAYYTYLLNENNLPYEIREERILFNRERILSRVLIEYRE